MATEKELVAEIKLIDESLKKNIAGQAKKTEELDDLVNQQQVLLVEKEAKLKELGITTENLKWR